MQAFMDSEAFRVFTYELAQLHGRRSALRRTAQDEAFSYGARHIAHVQAAESQRTILLLLRIRRDLMAIERRRAENYLAAAAAEVAA